MCFTRLQLGRVRPSGLVLGSILLGSILTTGGCGGAQGVGTPSGVDSQTEEQMRAEKEATVEHLRAKRAQRPKTGGRRAVRPRPSPSR